MASTTTTRTYGVLSLGEKAEEAAEQGFGLGGPPSPDDGRRGRVSIRRDLDINSFGVNAFYQAESGGAVIGEHAEDGPGASGHEELYVVVGGSATFTVDGDEVDAPHGTAVFVRPGTKRSARANEDGTIVLVVGGKPGEAYQGIDWGDAWPFHRDSLTAYREQRYADALNAVRDALVQVPDHPGLHYNYACFATLAGDASDDTFAHLRRSVELLPRFRDDARRDGDLAAIRDDPRFEQALG